MLGEMESHLARGESFALESTLASRLLAPFIARCKDAGYRFTLIYVWLHSAELAALRVAKRVASGGHDIPPDTIARRYKRGQTNFFELYLPLADEWSVWDNSGDWSVEVANGMFDAEEILQPELWEIIST